MTSLLEGLNDPEDVRRRRELVRQARQKEDDGEYLDGTFGLCRQACDKLDGAGSSLRDAHAILEAMDKRASDSSDNFHLRDLLKALSSAQARMSTIVRTFRRLEERADQQKEDDKERLDAAAELLHQACARMIEASVTIGEAQKLAETTDRQARTGVASRVTLSRRLRSREFLRAVSAVRGNLSRIVRSARTTANLQEGAVREAMNSEPGFE